MTNGFVIGLLVGGAAVLTGAAFYTHKKKTDKYAEIKKDVEETAEEIVDDAKSFKEKVQDIVLKSTEKIVEYKEKFDAATFLFGLMTSIVGFFAAVFNLRNSFKKEEPETRYYFLLPKDADENNFNNFIKELKEDRRILS